MRGNAGPATRGRRPSACRRPAVLSREELRPSAVTGREHSSGEVSEVRRLWACVPKTPSHIAGAGLPGRGSSRRTHLGLRQ